MENSTAKESYKETKKKAKEFYGLLGRIWCPALNDYVVFNNVGFGHLIRKRGMLRAKGEQKRRLNLLADVVDMIANSQISIDHQKKEALRSIHLDGQKMTVATPTDFWKFIQQKDGKLIKAIIRQFEGGAKHFFSAYAKKQKSAQ